MGAYWQSIPNLGGRRASILADQLGIRSLVALHASSVDEIVDALVSAGSRVTTDEVESWLRSARTQLKATDAADWSMFVASLLVEDRATGDVEVVRDWSAGCRMASGSMFFIDLELTEGSSVESVELLLGEIGAGERLALAKERCDREGTLRFRAWPLRRGLYRLRLRDADKVELRGPVLQVV